MTYTEQQLAIIRHMGEISSQIRAAAAARRSAQMAEAQHMVDAITALNNAMDYSAEMGRLCEEHGDAFREFLDTL